MKNTFLLILLSIPIIGFSQMRESLNSTDIVKYRLNGKVKELIHIEYKPRFLKDSTYTLDLGYAPSNDLSYKLKFDQKGNLKVKTKLRNKNDSLAKGTVWLYNYDSNNRIFQEKIISYHSPRDTTSLDYTFVGDSIINIKRTGSIFNNMLYSYRQEGSVEYHNVINSDSSYIGRSIKLYDRFDRIIRSEDYKNTNFIKNLKIKSYIDTISALKFKEVWIMPQTNFGWYVEYEYDKNGNQVKTIRRNFKNNYTKTKLFEYDFDKNGNWIEKRQFDGGGTLKAVFKREIKYYE